MTKTIQTFTFILGFLFCISPSFAQKKKDPRDLADLQKVVHNLRLQHKIEFTAFWMSDNVNLITNPNYFNFEWDDADLSLPYIGEGFTLHGLDPDLEVDFKGNIKRLEVVYSTNSERAQIRFQGKTNGKNRNYYLTLLPNGKAQLTVIFFDRTNIVYKGKYKFIESDESLLVPFSMKTK